MIAGKYRKVTLSVLFLLLSVNIIFAGTTGKISGRIIEKETGEPLIGVNVIVKGTTLGSTTDLDGYYTILQVTPGVHSVVASMVGYTPVTVNNVRVHIDQTSPVDIQLSAEAIEMEGITVVAERNIIKKDVSTSVAAVSPAEITVLPVSSINDVVGLQAGVEDGFVIRGGSADEALFMIDGVTLRDPRNNKPITSVSLGSIQEVSIERGGFNAEYGQVRSGIINIVGKEGGVNNYTAFFQMRYSPYTPKHFGESVYDPNSMWNRPYLDDEVAWTGTESGAWDLYTQRQYPRFEGWNSISQSLLSDNDPSNDLTPAAAQKLWMWQHRRRPAEEPDYDIDANIGGPVPLISESLGNLRFFLSYRKQKEMLLIPLSRDDYQESNWSLKLNSDITDGMKLMVTASNGTTYNVALNSDDNQFNNPAWGINSVQFWNPTDYLRTPYHIAEITNEQRSSRIYTDSWYSQAVVNNLSLAAKLTDFITNSTFYEVSFEHVYTRYSTGPERNRDLTRKYEITEGYLVDEAPYGYDPLPNTGIAEPGFFFGGHSSTIRDSSKSFSYVLKADVTSQVTKEHLIKAGLEFSSYDLQLDYGLFKPFFSDTNRVVEQWKPFRMAAYVQDKIEALGFIANIGIRMDVSNPNTEWADVGVFDESYFSSDYNGQEVPTVKSKVDISFSPRIGISHPITENSKLYFNYGHFKQNPTYEETFRLGRGPSGVMLNYGDPNLQLARTISYELGYDHVLFESYQLQVAAFYNDVSDQQAYTQYISDRRGVGYFKANNDSYEDVRGVELTLKKTDGDWVRGFASYTYQVNTRGAFGKPIINENPSQQKLLDQNTLTAYQQKPVPQPRANASITFLTPRDFGPDLGGINPFDNWSLNFLFQWEAGEYVTYNPFNSTQVINNVQLMDYLDMSLRLNKTFDFDFINVMLFVEVRNLLNSKYLSGGSFYDVHDQRYYFESLHLPSSAAYDNIPGEDRIGEYRRNGAAYQHIEKRGTIDIANEVGAAGVIYWERSSGRYLEFVNSAWTEVEGSRMQKVLDDKAYIDMPNNSSFDFLNPRQVFFGLNFSIKL